MSTDVLFRALLYSFPASKEIPGIRFSIALTKAKARFSAILPAIEGLPLP